MKKEKKGERTKATSRLSLFFLNISKLVGTIILIVWGGCMVQSAARLHTLGPTVVQYTVELFLNVEPKIAKTRRI